VLRIGTIARPESLLPRFDHPCLDEGPDGVLRASMARAGNLYEFRQRKTALWTKQQRSEQFLLTFCEQKFECVHVLLNGSTKVVLQLVERFNKL
jgi:hypothetical protein